MGPSLALCTSGGSRYWRRGGIALVVLALHGAAFMGLLVMHIVEVRDVARPHEPSLTYIALPPLPAVIPARSKSGAKGRGGNVVYFNPYIFGRPGPNAITIVKVTPYKGDVTPRCPLPLRPGTEEWKKRCAPVPPSIKNDNGVEEFSLVSHDSPAFRQWEAELKKRNAPVAVPCGYVRKDPQMFGPHESSSAMVDVGCAAKKWFGR